MPIASLMTHLYAINTLDY